MRQIEKEVVGAFVQGKDKRKGNTEARALSCGRAELYLHGNLIAIRNVTGNISVSLAGWPTVTTRSRLRALLDLTGSHVSIYQRDNVTRVKWGGVESIMIPTEWYQIV